MSFHQRPKTSLAFAKNAEPILQALQPKLESTSQVLEIGSGPGQHVARFATANPQITWHPSEANPTLLEEIVAWNKELSNVQPPRHIDLLSPKSWWLDFDPEQRFDLIATINVAHISPWEATLSLVQGASHLLSPTGHLYLYGPWRSSERPFEPSNQAFDQRLKSQNQAWGIRQIEDLQLAALEHGLTLAHDEAMPANNRSLFLQRHATS